MALKDGRCDYQGSLHSAEEVLQKYVCMCLLLLLVSLSFISALLIQTRELFSLLPSSGMEYWLKKGRLAC